MNENNKRVQNELIIDDTTYRTGLLWISCELIENLRVFLKKENRYFGIILSYYNSFDIAINKINYNKNDEDIYKKILFLIKPVIIKEYGKLLKKKVSRADCLIVILKKILEIINEDKYFLYIKQSITLSKIITRLFNNIKNKGKFQSLFNMANYIKNYMSLGLIGKYPLDKISIEFEETKINNKELLPNSEIKIENEEKIIEITWNED